VIYSYLDDLGEAWHRWFPSTRTLKASPAPQAGHLVAETAVAASTNV
jgi:hypothetical protein